VSSPVRASHAKAWLGALTATFFLGSLPYVLVGRDPGQEAGYPQVGVECCQLVGLGVPM